MNPEAPQHTPTTQGGIQRPGYTPKRWLLAPFTVLAVVMTFPYPSRLATHVPCDYGDAMFNLWVLRWVAHAAPDGFAQLWDTTIFYPNENTLAWSDPLLALAPVQWAIEQLSGSAAVGFNILYLSGWILSLWFTYRLGLHFTGHHGASVVAALAFTFSTPRLSHGGHFQLSATAWLVPFILLLLATYCRRPRPAVGVLLGLSLAALTITSSYYGVMMALVVGIVAAAYALIGRPHPFGKYLIGLAAGGTVALLIVAPVAVRYLEQAKDPNFIRPPDSSFSAHPGDFLAPDQEAYLLPRIPPFDTRAFNRGVENRLFPGIVALAFGAVGTIVLLSTIWRSARSREEDRLHPSNSLEGRDIPVLVAMTGAALALLVLAFGRHQDVFGRRLPMPYLFFERFVPGLESIRATSRFVIVAQCLLAVLAAIGLTHVLRRVQPRAALVISILLGLAVLAESATPPESVRLPAGPAALAVNVALASRPPGPVAELPMGSPSDSWQWAYIEAPRMYLATLDWQERVNGYSGFAPPELDEVAAALESFPSPTAFKHIDALGIRYIVLRTEPVGAFPPGQAQMLGENGVGSYNLETTERMLAALPDERVSSVERHGEAYLIELNPRA